MPQSISIDDIYAVVTGARDPYVGGQATTYRGIARRLGRDEMDPEVHELIRSMAVAGYIKQNPLGGFGRGPTPDAAGRRQLAAPGVRPAPEFHRRVSDDAARAAR